MLRRIKKMFLIVVRLFFLGKILRINDRVINFQVFKRSLIFQTLARRKIINVEKYSYITSFLHSKKGIKCLQKWKYRISTCYCIFIFHVECEKLLSV